MGGRRNLSCSIRRRRQKHAAGGGLEVTSVLDDLAAGLTQVPQLTTQTQLH